MDNTAQGRFLTERGEKTSAYVVGRRELTKSIVELLQKQNIEVKLHETRNELDPIKASYLFYFIEGEDSIEADFGIFKANIADLIKEQGKLIIIADNLEAEKKDRVEGELAKNNWPCLLVEIQGDIDSDEARRINAAGKIVRMAFSGVRSDRVLIVGLLNSKVSTTNGEKSKDEGFVDLTIAPVLVPAVKNQGKFKNSSKRKMALTVLLSGMGLSILVLILPILIVGGITFGGVQELLDAKRYLQTGKYDLAREAGNQAESYFGKAENTIRIFSWPLNLAGFGLVIEQVDKGARLGKVAADLTVHAAEMGPASRNLQQAMMGGEEEVDLKEVSVKLGVELDAVARDLDLIQLETANGVSQQWESIAGIFGIDSKKLAEYFNALPKLQRLVKQAKNVMPILPSVMAESGRRSYLVVFQNNAELRPTGGFIGSYAIVNFDSGRLLDYKINDIYAADGQLKGRVPPPDEILHFLGQPNWYMRDANFAADYPLTAARLEWFLEKETGQKVDGVIAVDLGLVQKILEVTGPIKLASSGEDINAENFFNKAEYAAEINFFPGSGQKRDFIGEVSEVVLGFFNSGKLKNADMLGEKISDAMEGKNAMIYLNSPLEEQAIVENGWGGSIIPEQCQEKINNCLMIVEANFGANKANYFLNRSINIRSLVDKGGGLVNTVSVELVNKSPSESWPGGKYKNYMRFLIPKGSKLISLDLDDGRAGTTSATLTAKELAKIGTGQFFIFDSEELALSSEMATASAFRSLGTLVEVPVGKSQKVTMSYNPPYKVDFTKKDPEYDMRLIKQPGIDKTKASIKVEFPSFLRPEKTSGVVSEQTITYNMDLLEDKVIHVDFKK